MIRSRLGRGLADLTGQEIDARCFPYQSRQHECSILSKCIATFAIYVDSSISIPLDVKVSNVLGIASSKGETRPKFLLHTRSDASRWDPVTNAAFVDAG